MYQIMELKVTNSSSSRILSIVILIIVMMAGSTPTAMADMCRSTGNVEVSVSPDNTSSATISYSFTNYNDYQVTVSATFTLIDSEGTQKSIARVIVLQGNESRKIDFFCSNIGMKVFNPSSCSVTFKVMKCD